MILYGFFSGFKIEDRYCLLATLLSILVDVDKDLRTLFLRV